MLIDSLIIKNNLIMKKDNNSFSEDFTNIILDGL